MKIKIDDNDLERLAEFESKILGLDGELKYHEDTEIEKIIRIEYLIEEYGNKIYDKIMNSLGYTTDDILEEEKFVRFKEEADKLKI